MTRVGSQRHKKSNNNNNNNIVIFVILYNNLNFLYAFVKQLRKVTVSFSIFLRRNGTKVPTGEMFS
jgi:hypothetical protein